MNFPNAENGGLIDIRVVEGPNVLNLNVSRDLGDSEIVFFHFKYFKDYFVERDSEAGQKRGEGGRDFCIRMCIASRKCIIRGNL
jgi:hypothetical protein